MTLYVPPWAPHISAELTEEDPTPTTRPVRVRATCSVCGKEWRSLCVRGTPRQTVGNFALLHLHGRDGFTP